MWPECAGSGFLERDAAVSMWEGRLGDTACESVYLNKDKRFTGSCGVVPLMQERPGTIVEVKETRIGPGRFAWGKADEAVRN